MAAVGGAQPNWSSRFAFLMASVGFAVGLGNIWRFPYVTGENGGAAFVLVYLACAFGIGVPILMAELMVGRRGRGSPPTAMANVAEQSGRSRHWKWVGGMGLLAAFVIEIIYSGIVGWVLWYLFKAITTGFAGMDAVSAVSEFEGMLANTTGMLFWTLLGLVITGLIIYFGVQDGIERAVRIMMPLLFCLLLGLAIYNVFAGGFGRAIEWLFTPDFSKISGGTVLIAVSQAFFSIGVAMGGMMTFGSYLPRSISISHSVLIIVVADTVVALLAGLVIFPAVFHHGLDPAAGPGLIFQTLPVAFAQMPGGHIFSVLFFLMLAVAGITSMVGLIETVTHWVEEKYGIVRHRSAMAVVGSIGVLGALSLMSYNTLQDIAIGGMNFNALLEYLYEKILLPLGGLLIAVCTGWVIRKEHTRDEFTTLNSAMYELWHFLIRFIVPPAVLIIFVMGVLG
jgi:NSS family neurotransmitter:Na+ symporter